MATTNDQERFQKLKAICVPLMGGSKLTPTSIKPVIKHLDELNKLLGETPSTELTPSLISYIFFPLSTILQRNTSAEIPDQVLEKLLLALAYLLDVWWWSCEVKVWEQIFILCGAIVGGIEGKGKGKARDDETKQAAVQCLHALLRSRTFEEASKYSFSPEELSSRTDQFHDAGHRPGFVPIIGQTLDSILVSAESRHLPLQHKSLEVLEHLLQRYVPDHLIPTILPGVVSTMAKLCFGVHEKKGWANGDTVSRALKVTQVAVVNAIGDDVCVREGALRRYADIDDLVQFNDKPPETSDIEDRPYGTKRTEAWLKGTSSQLHIAINSLSALVAHPTPSALYGLIDFSSTLLRTTPLTLPQTQPLLLSFLLSLSLSDLPSVSSTARNTLSALLTQPSDVQQSLRQTLVKNVTDNLSSLPRLISTQSESKVVHVAGLIEAVCLLSASSGLPSPLTAISKGVGKLLGPTGGIEKWGWSLLSVLEFVEPSMTGAATHQSAAQLSLEGNPDSSGWIPFPDLLLRNLASYDSRRALERMLQALGSSGGNTCLFAVEWFNNVAQSGTNSPSVAAMWCACRILEGIAGVSLSESDLRGTLVQPDKRLDKQVRSMVRVIAEQWDRDTLSDAPETMSPTQEDLVPTVQYQHGLIPLHETLKIFQPQQKAKTTSHQPILHRSLCLHLLSIAAGATQARFNALFIHALYPILHSLVSSSSFLSSTAYAALHYVTVMTSYATPANLLLSNFDYILDSVSRRLTQRWLDIDATKVLALMVRLVGSDIVDKAGDVVEECFDRLDEYHGYGIIVDGLMEVLTEVLKVIDKEVRSIDQEKPEKPASKQPHRTTLTDLFAFLPTRSQSIMGEDKTDYGPAPREAWGTEGGEEAPESRNPESRNPASNVMATDEPTPTPIQALTKQIVSRSMYFLTHDSPVIRSRVLDLLALSVPVLPDSALMQSIHSVWPFVLNRLKDPETFVVSAATNLVEALATHVGEFMFRRIWDDVWPIFRSMLQSLELGESENALTRRVGGKSSSESAYSHSHRIYRSILKTMTAALVGVQMHEASFWDVVVLFRRFLSSHVHEELQSFSRELYMQAGRHNPDAVWLALTSTVSTGQNIMRYLEEPNWDAEGNIDVIIDAMT